MPFVKFNDSSIFYESQGAGEPVILIPGFASGAWTWFRQTEFLAKDFQIITFDPRGIGKSKASDADLQTLSMQIFVEDVKTILDELNIEKANVLGASFGGFVAQEFALAFPERVDKLVLACTTAGGENHVKPDLEILRSFSPDPSLPLGEKIRRFIRPAFTDEFNRENAEEVEQVCQMREQNIVSDAAYLAQLQAAFTFDAAEHSSRIGNKTLVITGNRDSVVPMENSLNLAAKVPNAELKIIENGSHLFFIENADEFNQSIKNFLKGESV